METASNGRFAAATWNLILQRRFPWRCSRARLPPSSGRGRRPPPSSARPCGAHRRGGWCTPSSPSRASPSLQPRSQWRAAPWRRPRTRASMPACSPAAAGAPNPHRSQRGGQHGHPSSLSAENRLGQLNALQSLGTSARANWTPCKSPERGLNPSRSFCAFELL
eukprot:14472446-Alexandrium_andersonii.AAC.1